MTAPENQAREEPISAVLTKYSPTPEETTKILDKVAQERGQKYLQDELRRICELKSCSPQEAREWFSTTWKFRAEIGRLTELSLTDGLTSLYNKDFLIKRLEEEVERANRTEDKLSVLMFDMDHFKKINDTLGHQVGDIALQIIADTLKSECRGYDIVTRYGGEEFTVVLEGAGNGKAMEIAERIRGRLESGFGTQLTERCAGEKMELQEEIATLLAPDQETGSRVGTFSIGVRTYQGERGAEDTAKSLIHEADSALYYSKKTGRNKVTNYSPEVARLAKERMAETAEEKDHR